MEKQKKSQIPTYLSVLALLASFVIVIMFVVPKIAVLKDLSNKVALKESELNAGKQKVEDLKKASALIKTARSEMETLQIAVPTKEKVDEAVAQLSAASNQAGLSIQSITIGTPGAGVASLTVTTEGEFSNTVSFMANVEQILRPASFSDFSVASSQTNSLISATFNIAFPFIDEAELLQSDTLANTNQTEESNAQSGQ
jgi:Tfp pilus assembly protein PilO